MAVQTYPNARDQQTRAMPNPQRGKDISHDIAEYLTDYARQNPGHAALWCLGVGFVLGWKLKPW